MTDEKTSQKEIYTYEAPWTAYATAWCRRQDCRYKMAVGSFKEEYSNQIQIIQLHKDPQTSGNFKTLCKFDHPYPPTKIMYAPANQNFSSKDLLATTGDYLRLWGIDNDNHVEMKALLNNNKHSEFCAPLTSFDWNDIDPTIVGTCSIDTTCTIWDIVKLQPRTQLIAHDKEVYDIAFASGKDVFGTVGADGSLRMFDLRSLEHSTILYESHQLTSLLRLAWNKQDPNYIATILTDSSKAIILDVRIPSMAVAELEGHQAPLNGIAWAPHSACHICTCSDDKQALIWDLSMKAKTIVDPILAFSAEGEINTLQWDASHEDVISICYDNYVQVLKV